jgi:hypothetical protein
MHTGHPKALANLVTAMLAKDKHYFRNVKVITQQGTGCIGIFKNNLPIAIFDSREEFARWKHEKYLSK